MSTRQYEKAISTNGEFVIDPATGSGSSQLTVIGDSGGGNIYVGFANHAGDFVSFLDEDNLAIDLQPDSSIFLLHGRNVKLMLSVENTTAADFTVYRAEHG